MRQVEQHKYEGYLQKEEPNYKGYLNPTVTNEDFKVKQSVKHNYMH